MADALSDTTIDIIKATIPALEKGGTAVTDRMYQILFTNPQIRDLFNQSHHGETGAQSKALTAAVLAYGRNIDNLGVLASRIERITQGSVRIRASLPSGGGLG
jgi:nitric oxide dioxygenase